MRKKKAGEGCAEGGIYSFRGRLIFNADITIGCIELFPVIVVLMPAIVERKARR